MEVVVIGGHEGVVKLTLAGKFTGIHYSFYLFTVPAMCGNCKTKTERQLYQPFSFQIM